MPIPAGLRVQSVPGPDEKPHKFETVEEIQTDARFNQVRVYPVPQPFNPLQPGSPAGTLLSDPKGSQGDKLGVMNPEYATASTKPELYGLPHPTTIVVDQAGVIRFIETHEDYKNRTKVDEIIAAVGRARSPVAPK